MPISFQSHNFQGICILSDAAVIPAHSGQCENSAPHAQDPRASHARSAGAAAVPVRPPGGDSAGGPLSEGPWDGSLRPLAAARDGGLGFGWSQASSGSSASAIPQ